MKFIYRRLYMSIIDSVLGKLCKECGRNRTKNASGMCDECMEKIRLEKEVEIAKKRVLYCPNDGHNMNPIILNLGYGRKVVVYICDTCDGVFMNKYDLDLVSRSILEEESAIFNEQLKECSPILSF